MITYVLTLIKNSDSIIKSHGLDIERCKNGFFIRQCGIIIGRNLHSILTTSSVASSYTFAERMTHMSHRLTFTALRSALLSGDP